MVMPELLCLSYQKLSNELHTIVDFPWHECDLYLAETRHLTFSGILIQHVIFDNYFPSNLPHSLQSVDCETC